MTVQGNSLAPIRKIHDTFFSRFSLGTSERIAWNVRERELLMNTNRAGAFYRLIYRDRLLKRKDRITDFLNQPVKRTGSFATQARAC